MKARWEKSEKNEGTLHIEVDKEQVNSALDQAFKKVVKQVEVPGFRKGRVPRPLFEKRFGVESLYQDALDILLPKVYTEAVDETGIEPIDQPEVDVEQFEKDKELIFTAKVQVRPEVTLGEYKGLEVPEKDFTVTEDEVEAELERVRERQAELVVIEEGEVQDGDTVIIDFEGFKDGVAFEGGKAENHSLEIGSGSFIPGFEEQLIGLQKGAEEDIEVTFPEEYHSEELKGQKAVFKIKLHEIKRKKLPELNDDFAMDVSEFETLEEYKKDIEKTLQERKDREKEQYIETTVIDQAAQNAEVDVPEVMVTHEVDHMIQDFGRNLSMQGMNLETYYQFSGQDEQALREQMKEDAQKRVLNSLVLSAISEAENITAADEDVEEELKKMSEMYQQSVDEIREVLETNGSIENLKKDVEIRKTVELLVESSKSVPEATTTE